MVGLSDKPHRPSYMVARFMQQNGYEIIPVNPGHEQILGKTCYPNLNSIPERVDLVNIFRNSDAVLPIVKEAIQIDAKSIWMQLGVVNENAKKLAEEAGLIVIMDRCWKIEFLKQKE